MQEIAKKYLSYGLNTLPVKSDKRPVGKWKHLQTEKNVVNGQFSGCWGIAVLCGAISENLEIIDIDTKYDLSGTLFERYKRLINDHDKELLKKLVVEQSSSGGYHFIYRCSKIQGNQKLAQRETTEAEKMVSYDKAYRDSIAGGQTEEKSLEIAGKAKVNDKYRDLIETRGEGGYFVCDPSPKYKFIHGDFSKIAEISEDQRTTLFECARMLNEFFEVEEYKIPEVTRPHTYSGKNPFEDFNERADMISFLRNEGWKLVSSHGPHNYLLRPGGKQSHSADYNTEKKLLYIFSSSTEFEAEKAYNHISILKKYKFRVDSTDKEIAKWLFENGYGENKAYHTTVTSDQLTGVGKKEIIYSRYDFLANPEPVIKINPEDDKFDFLISEDKTDEYLSQVRDGTFKLGLSTGIPTLDAHFRLKEATVNVFLGHDNVGKSNIVWYLAVLSAKLHGWKWALHHSENKTGGVKRKLIEYATCSELNTLSDSEYVKAKKWVEEHFYFLVKDDNLTYKEFLMMGEKLSVKKKLNALLIDPYNSLYKPHDFDRHEWDYRVMACFRTFTEYTGASLFLNCHAVTEALRKKYPKRHEFDGFPMPPDKADTEGGGKFSNRADNFVTIHRMVQHEQKWNETEIHVKKIKEMETGGRQTILEKPVILKSIRAAVGFEDKDGYNPITGIRQSVVEEYKPNRVGAPKEPKDDQFPF